MSFFGGSLRLALKQSLAESSNARIKEKDPEKRKREQASRKKKDRRMKEQAKQDNKMYMRRNKLHAAAAASRKAQQQYLGIQSPTSEKQTEKTSSSKEKYSSGSNQSLSTSSSLSSSSSSSSSGSDSDSSTSNSSDSSSSSSVERNMFDTSSSEEDELDDKLKDTDEESEILSSQQRLEEQMRKDPPSACPKHLLITPNPNEKKRKQDIGSDQCSFSSYSKTGKRRKSEEIYSARKSPRTTVCSTSDRSMTSKKSSSSRKAKSITITPPTPDIIEWIETMSSGKLRSNIRSGHRVKVRFATGSSKKDKKKRESTMRRIKWYGGCISEVYADGKRVRIHYDDGTSEVSDFPDDDIVVDDTENGNHKVSAKAFIPPSLRDHKIKICKSAFRSPSPEPVLDIKTSSANSSVVVRNTGIDEVVDKDLLKTKYFVDNAIKGKKLKEKALSSLTFPTNVDSDRFEPHVSPPSTKASTVTESSYSLSSNNNSANEYSESSCSIASHDMISTPLQRKIDIFSSPPEIKPSLSMEPSACTIPKIKITNSFNTSEKNTILDHGGSQQSNNSSFVVINELSEIRNKSANKSTKNPTSLTIKLSGTKTKDSTDYFHSTNFEKPCIIGDYEPSHHEEVSPQGNVVVPGKNTEKTKFDQSTEGNSQKISEEEICKVASECDTKILSTEINGSTEETVSSSKESCTRPKLIKNVGRQRHEKNSTSQSTNLSQPSANTEAKFSNHSNQGDMKSHNRIEEKGAKLFSEVVEGIPGKNKKQIQNSYDDTSISLPSPFNNAPDPILSTVSLEKSNLVEIEDKSEISQSKTICHPMDTTARNISGITESKQTFTGLEENALVPMSRSGRLAAQKANERIVSKQELIVDEFTVPKRKKEKMEHKKKNHPITQYREEEQEPWVQCDRCMKWRLLPRSVQMDTLPDRWYCELNKYDPKHNHCDDPEETAEDILFRKKKSKISLDHDMCLKAEARTGRKYEQGLDFRRKRSVSPAPSRSSKNNNVSSGESDIKIVSRKSLDNTFHDEFNKPQQPTSQMNVEESSHKKKNQATNVSNNMNEKNRDAQYLSGKSKNASRNRGNRHGDKSGKNGKPGRQSKEKAENQEWVQCEKCEKWRKLPPRISAQDLPEIWYCSMNTWDISSASCSVAEDKVDPKTRVYTPPHNNAKFGSGGKLSYRNLIFGTGKRSLRPSSERARAAESLFAFATQKNNIPGESSGNQTYNVSYTNSSAFVPKYGANDIHKNVCVNNNLSFLEIMSKSNLWNELYRVNPSPQPPTNLKNLINPPSGEVNPSFILEHQTHDKRCIKDIVFGVVGASRINAHEVFLKGQQKSKVNVSEGYQWGGYQLPFTIEHVCSALEDLVKDGLIEAKKTTGQGNENNLYTIQYCRANKEFSRNSRNIKISKPWKRDSKR